MRGGLKYVPCQKVPTRGWESLWKHVSLERQDVDASFLSTSNLPLSALPGFLDQVKLIFSDFVNFQHSRQWLRSEIGQFLFSPRDRQDVGLGAGHFLSKTHQLVRLSLLGSDQPWNPETQLWMGWLATKVYGPLGSLCNNGGGSLSSWLSPLWTELCRSSA